MEIPYFSLSIVIVTLSFIWEQYLSWRQFQKHFTTKLPQEYDEFVNTVSNDDESNVSDEQLLKEIQQDNDDLKEEKEMSQITQRTFLKSQLYNRTKRKFLFVKDTIEYIIGVVMLTAGFYPYMWDISLRTLRWLCSMTSVCNPENAGNHEIYQSLIFMGYILLIDTVSGIPAEIYSTFVIEKRFGFNKQTPKLFIIDTIKSLLLGIAIGAPVLAAILNIIELGGKYFYIFICIFMVILSMFMMIVYPNFIAPLFNKFETLPDGELKQKITQLAQRLHFPLSDIFRMDASRRSAHSNAYFIGLFGSRRIVLYDTLIDRLDPDSILAVVAHEMGHWSRSHLPKNIAVAQIQQLLLWYSFGQMMDDPQLYQAFGFAAGEMPRMIGLSLFYMLFTPAMHIMSFLFNAVSRKFEYEADEFATKLGFDLGPSLTKLHVQNLGSMDPDSLYSAYHYSHPTLVERLRAIRNIKKE
eukprot:gb/GECH01013252.1/.p1 GENE.gb/GECH01013252.1/~~gb/GECH01013252.1/.p1  ORF type:complete len:467 (+),score=104.45 gb/GECH01013252.1/:1-1401(+)